MLVDFSVWVCRFLHSLKPMCLSMLYFNFTWTWYFFGHKIFVYVIHVFYYFILSASQNYWFFIFKVMSTVVNTVFEVNLR